MTRDVAVRMAEDLTAAGASISMTVSGDEWVVTASKEGGVTAGQINTIASKYSVASTINTAVFR